MSNMPDDIISQAPAFFEPAFVCAVVKVPRFASGTFPDADPALTTTMTSAGEAMTAGRSVTEALGKAVAFGHLVFPGACCSQIRKEHRLCLISAFSIRRRRSAAISVAGPLGA